MCFVCCHVYVLVCVPSQVYGDAVLEEAPLLILSNYNVTLFMKRSEDVQDKRLWVSTPIWWDSTDPSVRVCWLYALQQALEMKSWKAKLPSRLVPPTLVEDPILHQQLPAAEDPTVQQQLPAAEGPTVQQQLPAADMHQPARYSLRKRPRLQQNIPSTAASSKGNDVPTPQTSAPANVPEHSTLSMTDTWAIFEQLWQLADEEPRLTMDELGLTDTALQAGLSYGRVLQVSICRSIATTVNVLRCGRGCLHAQSACKLEAFLASQAQHPYSLTLHGNNMTICHGIVRWSHLPALQWHNCM